MLPGRPPARQLRAPALVQGHLQHHSRGGLDRPAGDGIELQGANPGAPPVLVEGQAPGSRS
eukprot:6716796-Alexandrium_andersonii.AAC.1